MDLKGWLYGLGKVLKCANNYIGMVKINMISVKKLIEYISMESIIKKRIVIRLDENKSLTEIPEGIVEQKCFYC